ncbi:MAG: hypothetical protein KQH83_01985 [Actinobacteria bacterium]|nr:hypothetical protein [Actinomycetota bacterium]
MNPAARRGPSTLAFHVSRIVIDAGVLLAMVAMNLSFVTSDTITKNSVGADALPVILLLAPVFVATLIPDHSRPMPAVVAWISLGLGAAAFPFAIVKYLDASNLAATVDGSVGFGARLLVFGTFVTIAGIGIGLAGSLLRVPGRPRQARTGPVRARQPQAPRARRQPGAARRTAPSAQQAPRAQTAEPQQAPRGGQAPAAPAARARTQDPAGSQAAGRDARARRAADPRRRSGGAAAPPPRRVRPQEPPADRDGA